MTTKSGSAFISHFNDIYYSFSPAVADLEREHPIFRETVRLAITPMLATLPIMTLAEKGSEFQVVVLGVLVMGLNIGMYVAVPAVLVHVIKRRDWCTSMNSNFDLSRLRYKVIPVLRRYKSSSAATKFSSSNKTNAP